MHVSRGAAFLTDYLPKINLGHWAKVAAEIIHYTGYERPFKSIVAPDPRDHKLGHMVGTADLMAQMADRCISKNAATGCTRNCARGRGAADRRERPCESTLRLGPRSAAPDAEVRVRYARQAARRRVQPRYRYLEILYGGRNPYMASIDRNLEYLQRILRSENWRLLRRQPPVFTGVEDSMATTRTLMLGAIKKVWG